MASCARDCSDGGQGSLRISHYNLAKVKATNPESMAEIRTALVCMGFTVSSVSNVVSQANKIFGAIQITLGVFGPARKAEK